MKRNNTAGFCTVTCLIAAVCWGFSGTCGQYLFQIKGVNASWLTAVRMLSSGIILLIINLVVARRELLALLRCGRDLLIAVAFALLGILVSQYCYLTAIQYSNSGTATVLQYLGPVFIMLIVCIKELRLPRKKEILALVCAVGGTFLLATHGNIHSLMISRQALVWGLLSAVGLVLYTMIPTGLLPKYGSLPVTGLAMIIGAVPLAAVVKPWTFEISMDFPFFLAMVGIVVVGTVIAYTLFIYSLKGIGPERASLTSCLEPVSATAFSALWLKTAFGAIDLVGFACILGAIVILTDFKAMNSSRVPDDV
ncbi:MAG: EamA family transporter [Oscillospiraceae bacterium]|nr:EamA family transporter [Oscillospiraceae bacterium]